MEKSATHSFKIYIIQIYQIVSFSPKLLPGIYSSRGKKANIKSKDKTK